MNRRKAGYRLKKINVCIFAILLLLISAVNSSARTNPWEFGVEIGLAGGPFFSVVGSRKLTDRANLDFTVGGFPRVMLRTKLDIRYSFFDSKLSPYLQGGAGYIHIFRWEHPDYDHIYEFHLTGGAEYSITKDITLKGDLGLMWAPHIINPQVKKEFPDVPPFVPLANIALLFE